jgi:3,4-dihydroxy 2-butanone 4-phosphate synthase/GTP cyclohydrolase II
MFEDVERAVAAIRAGRPVIVVDDENRENEGDLIFAAELATPELVAFMVRYTSGYICVPLPELEADRLELPPMYHTNQDQRGTAYAVTVDARAGVSTGISAADRAHTIRLLASAETQPTDLSRPGHVVPLRARPGGVLRRPGHTEAAIDLAVLAGLRPAGVLCEMVNDDGTMQRRPDLEKFAVEHDLVLISIADLIAYRRRTGKQVERVVETRLPTEHGEFTAVGYRADVDGGEHVALVFGDLGDGEDVLVRVHSECLTGDVFGSHRCDCGPQLDAALSRVADEGRGVVLYMRGHEGRGIGLLHKLQAYQLQDRGFDTVDANLELTNNPDKRAGLEGYGLTVLGREALPVRLHPENVRYLRTKRDRMGHLFEFEALG